MNITENNITKVWFENESIFIKTNTGDIKSYPLSWLPKLQNAPQAPLESFTLSPLGIHWEELHEDLSYDGFFHYTNQHTVNKK